MTSVGAPRRPAPTLVILGLTALLILSMMAALGIGAVWVPPGAVVEVVARRLGLGSFDVTLVDDQIVWQLRLPRVLGAAAAGAGLAIVGVVLQSLTRNELADPYLLGVSSGASVGAVSVIVLGVGVAGLTGSVALTVGAFVGAMLALVVVLLLATDRTRSLPPARTILAGVAVGQVCAAYTSFVVLTDGDGDSARRVLSWTLGSVAGVRWSSAVLLLVVTVVGLVVVTAYARPLDAFAFGESAAGSLGVDVNRTRWTLMIITALLTACLVAYTGAIGFVGLVVPHAARMLVGVRHHRLLPVSALIGAGLLVWADTAARSLLQGQEIPVGVVTAGVGAPAFAYLLARSRGRA
ncbi:MAG: iron chelate uptake ABC transporter family permease subunit [Aeromicrobium erythreum]